MISLEGGLSGFAKCMTRSTPAHLKDSRVILVTGYKVAYKSTCEEQWLYCENCQYVRMKVAFHGRGEPGSHTRLCARWGGKTELVALGWQFFRHRWITRRRVFVRHKYS